MSPTTKLRRKLRQIKYVVAPLLGGGPTTPADVGWVYRMLLGRQPEDRAVTERHARRYGNIEALLAGVMASPEFQARWQRTDNARATLNRPKDSPSASDVDVIRSFRAHAGPGSRGFVTDFLGTKTRIGFVRGLDAMDGEVEGHPIPGNFHAAADEWAGTLRSVLEADGEFVGVELGAGWGPWLTACAAACERRGVRRVKLVGLEAAAGHVAFMRDHFPDNGLDPDLHTLLHGAAAAEDGYAEFPDLNDPALDYGATLSVRDPLLHRVIGPSITRVRAYSIPTLLDEYRRVDLVHIDIQGSEADVVAAARPTLKAKVRRLVIGTHGRAVEQRLLEDLSADGWQCETDHPCRYAPHQGGLALAVDGCQVWRNPGV